MTRNVKDELEWQRLDLELDRDLDATFPASDALKITRRQPDTFAKSEQPKIKKDSVGTFPYRTRNSDGIPEGPPSEC